MIEMYTVIALLMKELSNLGSLLRTLYVCHLFHDFPISVLHFKKYFSNVELSVSEKKRRKNTWHSVSRSSLSQKCVAQS